MLSSQSQIPGINVNENDVDTNIVFFQVLPDAKLDALALMKRLEQDKGIHVGGKCPVAITRGC